MHRHQEIEWLFLRGLSHLHWISKDFSLRYTFKSVFIGIAQLEETAGIWNCWGTGQGWWDFHPYGSRSCWGGCSKCRYFCRRCLWTRLKCCCSVNKATERIWVSICRIYVEKVMQHIFNFLTWRWSVRTVSGMRGTASSSLWARYRCSSLFNFWKQCKSIRNVSK